MNPKSQRFVTSSLTNRKFYLPRLAPEFYRGDAAVHWTLTIFDRKIGWLNHSFHFHFRELMLHAAAREKLFCPVYCLMPDHIHLLWLGLSRDSDQRNGMSFLRTHLEPFLSPHKFQPQAHDHVLRQEERRRNAFAKICFYILDNPVRAGLVHEPERFNQRPVTASPTNEAVGDDVRSLISKKSPPAGSNPKINLSLVTSAPTKSRWPFCGAVIPGYPMLHPLEDDFWPLFWKLYEQFLQPEAAKIRRSLMTV